jgi:MFS transporter, DHA2 family, multidrug resistance protein
MSHARQPLAPLHGPQLAIATFGVSLATFMQVLDTTIANVSVPTIAGSMGISATQGTWVITSFTVATAISMPLTGRLAERLGQVRLFLLATTLFTIASILCGLAPNMPTLIGARVLQGAVAGPLMPLSQALMLSIYPREKRGQALALWATIAVVAPIVGPILGGYISDNASWPWIFFINGPVGVLAVLLTTESLRRMDSSLHKPPIDWIGLVLLAVWVGVLQVMLDLGSDENWFDSPLIIALTVVTAVVFCYFLVWEFNHPFPIVDLSLFRDRNFAVGAGGGSLIYGAFFGSSVLLPLVLQTQFGYTATLAGLVVAPVGLAPILGSRFVGRNYQRVDPRVLITLAFLITACVMWLRSHSSTDWALWNLLEPQLLLGVGVMIMFTPLTAVMLSTLDPHRSASALGVSSFMRLTASGFGASLFTSLWQSRAAQHHTRLAEAINAYDPLRSGTFGMLTSHGLGTQQAYGVVDATVTNQAFVMAANDVFWLAALSIVAVTSIVWLARPPFHFMAAPVVNE